MTAPGGILGAMKGIFKMMVDIALMVSVGVGCFVAGVVARPFIGGRRPPSGIQTWVYGYRLLIPSFAMGIIVNQIMTPDERATLQSSAPDDAPQWIIDAANAAWERAALQWCTRPEYGLRWAERNIADDVLTALIELARAGEES